jgi:cell division initiation protein
VLRVKLTPLDIRRQEFKRVVRGVDPEEVSVFLDMVAGEYERVLRENKTLSEELEGLRRKVEEFDGMKDAIQGAVVMAKKGADDALSHAKKEAELKLKEAEVNADRLIDDARRQAETFRKEINDIRNQRSILISRMKSLLDGQMRMLEAYLGDWEEDSRDIHLGSVGADEARGTRRGAVAGSAKWIGHVHQTETSLRDERTKVSDRDAGAEQLEAPAVPEGIDEMVEADRQEASAEGISRARADYAEERPALAAVHASPETGGPEREAELDESIRSASRPDLIRFLRASGSLRQKPLKPMEDHGQLRAPRPPRPTLDGQAVDTVRAVPRTGGPSGQVAPHKPSSVAPERETRRIVSEGGND